MGARAKGKDKSNKQKTTQKDKPKGGATVARTGKSKPSASKSGAVKAKATLPKTSGQKGGKKIPAVRTASGKVPQGRTLSTHDHYIGKGGKTGSKKERPVVVIEADDDNDLAVVPLSTRDGKNRTKLKNYQQGKSYFKHYIEIEDDEGKPIRINAKFRENSTKLDVSDDDVEVIRNTVINHCQTKQKNQKILKKFADRRKNR